MRTYHNVMVWQGGPKWLEGQSYATGLGELPRRWTKLHSCAACYSKNAAEAHARAIAHKGQVAYVFTRANARRFQDIWITDGPDAAREILKGATPL